MAGTPEDGGVGADVKVGRIVPPGVGTIEPPVPPPDGGMDAAGLEVIDGAPVVPDPPGVGTSEDAGGADAAGLIDGRPGALGLEVSVGTMVPPVPPGVG